MGKLFWGLRPNEMSTEMSLFASGPAEEESSQSLSRIIQTILQCQAQGQTDINLSIPLFAQLCSTPFSSPDDL